MKITITEKLPPIVDYIELRKSVGWTNGSKSATVASLKNSLYCVCLEHSGELVAFGRVVGDGVLNFYIQDIIVKEGWRGQGLSKMVMDRVMDFIGKTAKKGSFIGLFSSKGVEGLYERYGFIVRPHKQFGAGMFQIIK